MGHYVASMDKRRPCVTHMHFKLVHTFCTVCGVFLCLKPNCFIRFHELDNYLFDDPTYEGEVTRFIQEY